jgi:hypothetical protein
LFLTNLSNRVGSHPDQHQQIQKSPAKSSGAFLYLAEGVGFPDRNL